MRKHPQTCTRRAPPANAACGAESQGHRERVPTIRCAAGVSFHSRVYSFAMGVPYMPSRLLGNRRDLDGKPLPCVSFGDHPTFWCVVWRANGPARIWPRGRRSACANTRASTCDSRRTPRFGLPWRRPRRSRLWQGYFSYPEVLDKLLAATTRGVTLGDPGEPRIRPVVAPNLSSNCSGAGRWPEFGHAWSKLAKVGGGLLKFAASCWSMMVELGRSF